MPAYQIALLFLLVTIPLMIFSIPLVAIWTHHRRKMEELRNHRSAAYSEDVRAEFASVRADIKSLRDTTMQYDLSFDTNLQQLERRLAKLERPGLSPVYATDEASRDNRYVGR